MIHVYKIKSHIKSINAGREKSSIEKYKHISHKIETIRFVNCAFHGHVCVRKYDLSSSSPKKI